MRYRQLSSTGDYTFGQGQRNFFIDDPEAVAQLVLTRLRLDQGDWFLDTQEGTPYSTQILGRTSQAQRDAAVRNRILTTQGVKSIVSFSSAVVARKYSVLATINTIFGQTTVEIAL